MNGFLRYVRTYNETVVKQGNMYPIVGGIAITNASTAAIIPSRPVAGTARDGTLEVLVHRRLIDGDKRGDDHTILVCSLFFTWLTFSPVCYTPSSILTISR